MLQSVRNLLPRNPFTNALKPEEQQQMHVLQRLYELHVDDTLHTYVDMLRSVSCGHIRFKEDSLEQTLHTATRADIQRGPFQARFGDSLLSMGAESLVACVLRHQRLRWGTTGARRGYANDPENLLCELLKTWSTDVLSNLAVLSRSTAISVQRFADFVHAIIRTPEFRSMQPLLVEVSRILREECVHVIEKELSGKSSREALCNLVAGSERLLQHGVQLLAVILQRGVEVPMDVRVGVLQRADPPFRKFLRTTCGTILRGLAMSDPVRRVFSLPGQEDCRVNGPQLVLQEEERASSSLAMYLPEEMQTLSIVEVLSGSKELVPTVHDALILKSFVALHDALMTLARGVLVLKHAHAIAGRSGDLGLYGLASGAFGSILHHFSGHCVVIRRLVERLVSFSDLLFEEVVLEPSRKRFSGFETWSTNYFQVRDIQLALHRDISSMLSEIGELQREAATVCDVQSELQRLMDDIQALKHSARSFVRQVQHQTDAECGLQSVHGAAQLDPLLPSVYDSTRSLPYGLESEPLCDCSEEYEHLEITYRSSLLVTAGVEEWEMPMFEMRGVGLGPGAQFVVDALDVSERVTIEFDNVDPSSATARFLWPAACGRSGTHTLLVRMGERVAGPFEVNLMRNQCDMLQGAP